MEVKAEKVNPYEGDDRNKGEQVRDMFDSIAPAYDFMNRAMTMGIDTIWRKKAVAMIAADAASKTSAKSGTGDCYKILDVATGTGDLAIMMCRRVKGSTVTGIDLSKEMMERGKVKVKDAGLESRISFQEADCLKLPFADGSFDCVSVAFGVRNFEHLLEGYREMCRVLKPGGMLCVIELSTPTNPLVKPFYSLYTTKIIPLVGRMISNDSNAYTYLPASIAAVPQREEMASLISEAGFSSAKYRRLTFGVCTIYSAQR